VKYLPQVEINDAGSAVAVWQTISNGKISIWASRYEPGVGWDTEQTIEADDRRNAFNPKLGLDEAGNALVVWNHRGGGRLNIVATRYLIGSGWGTPAAIDVSTAGNSRDVQIAMTAAGNAIAIWQQDDGSSVNVWSNTYDLLNGWGIADYVENNTDGGNALRPRIGVDGSGNAIAVWQQRSGDTRAIWASRWDGSWDAAQLIEPVDYARAGRPDIAVDGDGNAIVVWEQDDSGNGGDTSVWASRYDAGSGSWLQARPIETFGGQVAKRPRAAIDQLGNAAAIWIGGRRMYTAQDSLNAAPPVADAGADQSGFGGDVIIMDGSASFDPNGQELSYFWSQLSGVEVDLRRKGQVGPWFIVPQVESITDLVFILTVTNTGGITWTDTVTVTAMP
jgi:hypothetical protein